MLADVFYLEQAFIFSKKYITTTKCGTVYQLHHFSECSVISENVASTTFHDDFGFFSMRMIFGISLMLKPRNPCLQRFSQKTE